MKLYFLLARRVPPVPSPVLIEVFHILTRRGFDIETGVAEEVVQRPEKLRVQHDLYLLKSHTELSLSLAGALHSQGARLLNPYLNCVAVQNKIVASRILRSANIPTPDSWVTGDLELLSSLAEQRPLIVKPYMGHRGQGLTIVRSPRELSAMTRPEHPVLVQHYIEGATEDLKVYVVGEEVFAVRKEFSPTSFAQAGKPCPVGHEAREIALRCGKAFGLGLYGVDIIMSSTGPWVVDVNTFPGYKGVARIAPRIARYIERYARGETTLAARCESLATVAD